MVINELIPKARVCTLSRGSDVVRRGHGGCGAPAPSALILTTQRKRQLPSQVALGWRGTRRTRGIVTRSSVPSALAYRARRPAFLSLTESVGFVTKVLRLGLRDGIELGLDHRQDLWGLCECSRVCCSSIFKCNAGGCPTPKAGCRGVYTK